jgi:SAM-dependent methyltransferase
VTCSCGGNACDSFFSEKTARRDARAYLRRGLRGDARWLADNAAASGVTGSSVLEIGGGVGAIQAALLREGALVGTVVDVVPAYERYARELADQAGIADRTQFIVADLTEQPDAVESADIVVLRRVVCCSPYGPRLLGIGAGLTRRVLVASYPRRTGTLRTAAWLQNRVFALLGRGFRVYIHDPDVLEAEAGEHGLRRAAFHRGLIWESVAFEHPTSTA